MLERDHNGTPCVSYTRGTDLGGSLQGAGGISGLLARTDNSVLYADRSSAHNYYHADANGNITALLTFQQGFAAKYCYDPFGNIVSQSGLLADANVYRFSSKEFHAKSGLTYYLRRFYAPALQRWLNRDPIEEIGGINLFGFNDNDPANNIDIFGLAAGSIGVTVFQAIASGSVAQMEALLAIAGDIGLSAAEQAALRAALAKAAQAAALAAAAAVVCEMARHESGQKNYINDAAAEISKKTGDPICTVLRAMMTAAKADNSKAGKALQQTIKQAMKAAGCTRIAGD